MSDCSHSMLSLGFHLIEKILLKLPRREWINISLLNRKFHAKFFGNHKFLLRVMERLDYDWFHKKSKKRVIQTSNLESLRMGISILLKRRRLISEFENRYPYMLPRHWHVMKERDSYHNLRTLFLFNVGHKDWLY